MALGGVPLNRLCDTVALVDFGAVAAPVLLALGVTPAVARRSSGAGFLRALLSDTGTRSREAPAADEDEEGVDVELVEGAPVETLLFPMPGMTIPPLSSSS